MTLPAALRLVQIRLRRHQNNRNATLDLSIPDVSEQPAAVVDGVAHLDWDGRSHDCPDVVEAICGAASQILCRPTGPAHAPLRIVLPALLAPRPRLGAGRW